MGSRLAVVPAVVFLTILGFCDVERAHHGLDPSWALGLTKAAEAHLLFGRDIIFTYGPLGYLVAGAADERMWRAMVFGHLLLAALLAAGVVYALRGRPLRQSVPVYLVICLTVAIVDDRTTIVCAAVVACALFVFAHRSERRPYEALAIGILAGIGTLVKFTFAIEFAAGIVPIVVFELWQGRRDRARLSLESLAGAAFGIGWLATIGAYFCSRGLGPPIALCIWIAAVAATVFAMVRPQTRGVIIFGLVATFGLLLPSDLWQFVRMSLEISLGYSAGMSFGFLWPATQDATIAAVCALAIVACAALLRKTMGWGFPIGLALIAWINFKEGFVRRGPNHSIEFYFPIAIISALLIAHSRTRLGVATSVASFTFCFLLLAGTEVIDFLPQHTQLGERPENIFTIQRITEPLARIATIFTTDHVPAAFRSDLADDRIAARDVKLLGSQPVDVQPWEIGVVFANGLAWKPEPIFQSYSAYTSKLDATNQKALLVGGPVVLFDYALTIDFREPMAESPLARKTILCDYVLDGTFGRRPVKARNGDEYAVLVPLGRDRCTASSQTITTIAHWNAPVSLPATKAGEVLVASMRFRYTLLGSIAKFAYKPPPVFLVSHTTGRADTARRILPATSESGFVVSPRLGSTKDFIALSAGTLAGAPTTLTLKTFWPNTYAPDIDVRIVRMRLGAVAAPSQSSTAAKLSSRTVRLSKARRRASRSRAPSIAVSGTSTLRSAI